MKTELMSTMVRFPFDKPIQWYLGVLTLFAAFSTYEIFSMSYQQQALQYPSDAVSRHTSGNSGATTAFKILHNHGEHFVDLNLISTAIAGDSKTTGSHRASMVNAYLPNVDLSGAWLDHTDFTDSTLTEAYLNDIRMDDGVLDGADLTAAHLEGAAIERTSMSGTIANMLNASEVRLEGIRLIDAEFKGATLENSYIGYTRASNSIFSDASLDGALLSKSHFVNVLI